MCCECGDNNDYMRPHRNAQQGDYNHYTRNGNPSPLEKLVETWNQYNSKSQQLELGGGLKSLIPPNRGLVRVKQLNG
jgi:hypothetical protein